MVNDISFCVVLCCSDLLVDVRRFLVSVMRRGLSESLWQKDEEVPLHLARTFCRDRFNVTVIKEEAEELYKRIL